MKHLVNSVCKAVRVNLLVPRFLEVLGILPVRVRFRTHLLLPGVPLDSSGPTTITERERERETDIQTDRQTDS